MKQLRLKVAYLGAENRIRRDQFAGRPKFTDGQRITLANIGKKLGREALEAVACIVTPDTILRWHRELVAARFDSSKIRKSKTAGRPPTDPAIVNIILRIARENPTWGYRWIAGALLAIDHSVSHQTVKNILEEHRVDPAPSRKSKTSLSDAIRSHTDFLLATDFLAAKIWTAFGQVTYYRLFYSPW